MTTRDLDAEPTTYGAGDPLTDEPPDLYPDGEPDGEEPLSVRVADMAPLEAAYARAMHDLDCEVPVLEQVDHELEAHEPWSGSDLDGVIPWARFEEALAARGVELAPVGVTDAAWRLFWNVTDERGALFTPSRELLGEVRRVLDGVGGRRDVPIRRPRHGRHCPCSACARQDWTDPTLADCGMHGAGCPREYAP